MSTASVMAETTPQHVGSRAFVAVWLPSLVVIIASGACLFTLSWWISQSPGGGADLGLIIGGSSVISLVTVTALSGMLDRADRRASVVRLLVLLMAPIAALMAIFGREPHTLALLAAGLCYVLISTCETLYLATTETVAADLAPPAWPQTRTALLTQIHSQVERVIAPTLAGLLITAGAIASVPAAALAVVVAMIVVTYLNRRHFDVVTAHTSEAARQGAEPATGPVRALVRDAASALRLVRDHPDLIFLIRLGILANLVVFPFYAILPAFLSDYVSTPAQAAVWFSRSATAYGVGMLTGTVLLVRFRRKPAGHRALAAAGGCLALICLVLLALSYVRWPAAVVTAMAINGGLFVVLVAVGGAVWLDRTPAEVRVRVFSLRRLTVFSSIPVGTMLMGIGGAAFGYRPFVRVLILAVLVVLAASLWRFWRTPRTPAPTDPDERQRRPG